MPQDLDEPSCLIVRRYFTEALFGGGERALLETVGDPELSERAWLFWAAFTDRTLEEIDVLFANADGSWVACHLSGTVVQQGPWITSSAPDPDQSVSVECTGTYQISDGRIVDFRETWR
jgi:limonene-1,2-epoxide hydrolase